MYNQYKKLFLKTKNVDKSSYIWNAIYGLVFAMQSAVMLMVIARTNGIDDAGIFSIAYAIAGMMSFIGEFGVRRYQVSDIAEVNSFADYFTFRLMSCTAMMLACAAYGVYGLISLDYSITKFEVIMLVGFVKLVESFSDVFYGRYQQMHRLDVAAKTNSVRVIAGMVCCTIALCITSNLLISCVVWAISVLISMMMTTLVVSSEFCQIRVRFKIGHIKNIFWECIPLFLGSFLLIYVGNAPKYAIDACMNEESQACFNFIFMPVFVVSMLAGFIFNPIIVKMAEEWADKNYKAFDRIVFRQFKVIFGLTLLAIAVALTIGIPVLGFLYHTDLSSYKLDLCILMVGSGMLALINFITIVMTVIRGQKSLSIGYILVAIMAFALSRKFVEASGVTGATVLYTVLMTALAVVFLTVYFIKKNGEKKRIC